MCGKKQVCDLFLLFFFILLEIKKADQVSKTAHEDAGNAGNKMGKALAVHGFCAFQKVCGTGREDPLKDTDVHSLQKNLVDEKSRVGALHDFCAERGNDAGVCSEEYRRQKSNDGE